MTAQNAGVLFAKHYAHWIESGAKSVDGMTFELTFLEMLRSAGQEILQGSVGDVPQNRNKKNDSNVVG